MEQIADNIWIFDGDAVPFFTLPYTTRMTIVRFPDGALWVHSPIKLTSELQSQVDALGQVKYLIAPNQLHHLFLGEWQQTYPHAQLFGTQGVQRKRPDIEFDALLTPACYTPWEDEIDSLLFTGSRVMEECVFFHHTSQVLIVTDLIENFAPEAFTPLKRLLAKSAGILAPDGQMPLDWRLSFLLSKTEARQHRDTLLSWHPQQIIMAHGLIIRHDATAFLQRSFRWLD